MAWKILPQYVAVIVVTPGNGSWDLEPCDPSVNPAFPGYRALKKGRTDHSDFNRMTKLPTTMFHVEHGNG
jgi:hypothetical protein